MAILLKEKEPDQISSLIKEVLKAARPLSFPQYYQIEQPLTILAGKDKVLIRLLSDMHHKKKKAQLTQKITPWLAILLTLLLCIAMYFYSTGKS